MTTDPRYPIGKFSFDGALSSQQRQQCLDDLEQTPARIRTALRGLSDAQIDTPYREGGWTLRQVAHHMPDSHMNAYVRFKMALTEDEPTIKVYLEDRWAELPEAKKASMFPWRCSTVCTNAGCSSCAVSPMPTGSAATGILNLA